MKPIFILSIYVIALFSFQYKAFSSTHGDTITTRSLVCHETCFVFDASNTSGRKNIYDASAYARMQAWSSCPADSFPEVDFNKHMLLMVRYTFSGCTRNVDRIMKCVVDHQNKKLLLQVIVYQKGPCRPVIWANELFPIPIVPENYTIELRIPDSKIPIIIPAQD